MIGSRLSHVSIPGASRERLLGRVTDNFGGFVTATALGTAVRLLATAHPGRPTPSAVVAGRRDAVRSSVVGAFNERRQQPVSGRLLTHTGCARHNAAPGGRDMLKVLAAVGALVLVVGGALVYLIGTTAVASNRARTDSIALLESVRTHGNEGYLALQMLPQFALSSGNVDFGQAAHTAGVYAAQLSGNRAVVQADETRLRTDRDRLSKQAAGILALPFRSGLDHERLRAESLLSALQAEDTAQGIAMDQYRAVSALFDAEGVLQDLSDQTDIPSMLAIFPVLDARLQTAAQAAAGPNMPPQLGILVTAMQALSTDANSIAQAAQRGNRNTALALIPKLRADVNAVQSFDARGFDSYQQALFQPYEDKFNTGVRAAGFTPQWPQTPQMPTTQT